MDWFDQVRKSSASAIARNGEVNYSPFNPYTELYPSYAKEFLDWLYSALEKHKSMEGEKKLTNYQLAKGFLGPQLLRRTLFDVDFMSKSCKYDEAKTKELLAWFRDILFEKCTADPFGFDSTQMLTKEDIKYIMQMFPFHPPVEGEAADAIELVETCKKLAKANFLWNTQEWFDTYGPYTTPSGRKIMLHAFTNFEPSEVWPHTAGFDPSTVYIYTIHDNAEIKVDFYGRVNSVPSLTESMTGLLIFEHGRLIKDPARIKELNIALNEVIQKQALLMESLDAKQLKQKEIELHCYMYRELYKLLGLEWNASKELVNAVERKELN